jgi:hypothetical protein
MSMAPAITYFPGAVEPKSLKFIAGVNATAEKLFTGVNDTAGGSLNENSKGVT